MDVDEGRKTGRHGKGFAIVGHVQKEKMVGDFELSKQHAE